MTVDEAAPEREIVQCDEKYLYVPNLGSCIQFLRARVGTGLQDNRYFEDQKRQI